MLLYICVKFCENMNGIRVMEYMVEMAMFNFQRVITQKVGKPELRFMFSAHSLMVFYIVLSFITISQMVSELWSRHEMMKR